MKTPYMLIRFQSKCKLIIIVTVIIAHFFIDLMYATMYCVADFSSCAKLKYFGRVQIVKHTTDG